MADGQQPVPSGAPRPGSGLFHEPTREKRSFPTPAVLVAVAVVLVAIGLLVGLGRRHTPRAGSPDTLRPAAAYASHVKLSDLAMSESTSFAGGKSTYIDGRVTNTGPATITDMTVQVLFASDGGGAPQLESVPLDLIRTRQPYLDVEPIRAAPLAPGANAEFRLIFEGIRPEWNQQTPEIHVVDVVTR